MDRPLKHQEAKLKLGSKKHYGQEDIVIERIAKQ